MGHNYIIRKKRGWNMTKREYLVSLGQKVGKRGRFTKEQGKYKKPRKYSKSYCKSTPCDEMGFTQKASCRPYKNCYK